MNFFKILRLWDVCFFWLPSFTGLRFFDQQITYAPTIEVGAKGDRNVRINK